MNICFVTMLYGPGIPVLFPIGLVALIVLYLIERYSVAKYYRMPPNFSDALNRSCLDAVLWAPFLYACLGFWMYSNRQVFENIVLPVTYLNEVVRYDHKIIGSVKRISPGTPFLILLAILIVLKITKIPFCFKSRF